MITCTKCDKRYDSKTHNKVCPHKPIEGSKEISDEEIRLNNIHADLFGGIKESTDGQDSKE